MSFKKAFKTIFKIYQHNGRIGANQIDKIAERYNVNFHKLENAVLQKGLELNAYCSW